MYPSSERTIRSNRTHVDAESAAFYAGTTFRTFKEMTLAAGGELVVKMTRPVDLIIRKFAMKVTVGELRCDIYRGATPGGTWNALLPIIASCEFADLPQPIYAAQCSLESGGTVTGGVLYDVMHVKTSGTSAQSFTIGDEIGDMLGIPKDSVGLYKFTNPGNVSATGIFMMRWEELPIK